MMKRAISVILCAILALCLFCGCGGAAPMASDMAAAESAPAEPEAPAAAPEYEAAYDKGYEYGYYNSAPATGTDMPASEESSGGDGSGSLPLNTKLIYTAYLDLESTAFDRAVEGLEQLVKDTGAYYESSSVNNYGSYRHGQYTIRVPAKNFDAFCSAAGQLCQLNSIDRSAQDVSEAYYDTESRLVTQQTKLERLQNLLAKAEVMEDIISLETAISETELQIERLTGSLRKYDSLVGYSTVTISLNEVFELTQIEEPVIGFGAKLGEAFKKGSSNFVDGLQSTMLRFARNWVGWIIWIVIIAAAVFFTVRGALRRRARRNPPPAPIQTKTEDKK